MHLCLYLKKSVNTLPKIILQLCNRSNVSYYQTVRMSDLRDELYEDTVTNSDRISLQNEKNDLKSGKKRIIKIKIKMSDIKNHIETENSALREICILERNENDESLNVKTPGRIQTVELIECADISPELDCNKNLSINGNDTTNSIKFALASQKCDKNNKNENIEDGLGNELEESCDEYIEALLIREQRNFEKLSAELRRVDKEECLADMQEKCCINTVSVEEEQSIYLDIDNNDANSGRDIENIVGPSNESIYEIYSSAILDDGTINGDIENSHKEETSYKTIIESEDTEEKKESLTDTTIYEEIQSLTNEEDNTNKSSIKEDKSTCPDIQDKKEIGNNTTTSDPIWKNAYKNYLLLDNNNSGKITNVHDKTLSKLAYGNISTINNQENVPGVHDEEKIKDSLIIREIVMKKYEEILSKFSQKSVRRKNNKNRQSVCEAKEKMESNRKIERPTNLDIQGMSYSQDFLQLYNKTPDSGLDASRESNFSKLKSGESFKTSDETLKYSPTVFLKEALGDDYINVTYDSEQENSEHHYYTPLPHHQRSTARSIGSSDISTLVSTLDGVDSLYSTIDKTQKKRLTNLKKNSLSHPLFKSTSSETYIYESIDKFRVHPKSEELHHAISVQCAIIAQASKALSLCRKSARFFGSIPHLEAEKCLLLAMHRKRLFENQFNRDYEKMECEQCYGTVNIENLAFSLNTTRTAAETGDIHYYMCLIHSDVTLLASDIVFPERNGDIILKGSFQFNNLTSDFKIYIKMYSMILEKDTRKKKPYLSPNKICSTWRNGKIYNKHLERLSEMSSFRLCGIYKLGIADLYNTNAFTLEKVSPNGSLSENFTADIQSSIEITNHINGFLTIGTTNILWNRRWCSLDGHFLKYWNYPSDENDKEPIGIFDLSNCTTSKVITVEKAICSRSRTVTLEILSERETVMQYFLQADNMVEFEEWKRQLNSVLNSLNNWKCLKC